MSAEEELAGFIAACERSGLDMDHASTAEGVIFKSEKTARIFSERHNKRLVQIDGGWLAKDAAPSN